MTARADDIPGVLSSSGILPTPTTREEINRRRAIAAVLASRARPFPTTIGQGLTSMGEAFGDVMAEKRLNTQEAELQRRVGAELSPAAAPPPVGAAAAVPPPTAAPVTPPVAAAPVRPPAPILTPAAPTAADPRDLIARAAMARGGADREGIIGPVEPQPAREVALPDPTQAGEVPPPTSTNVMATATPSTPDGGDDPIWAARQGAISGIESRGAKDPYRAVGAPTKYGRGIGRYQVVEANIAPWTQAALGQALTPEQYLASPQAQDAVFKHRFGQYVDRFGEEGAARAWFGGPGNVNKTDLTDLHKRLSIGDYGKSYMEGLKAGTDPTRLAYASTGTATDALPVGAKGGMVIPPLTEENPVTPSDITPAPTRVAEARGVVPGAAPTLPPSRGAAPADYDMPEPKPPKEPQRIPETDLQQRARRALAIDPEHRGAAAIWAQGEAQRKFDEQREVERYRSEMTHYNTLHTKWQDLQINRKKRGLEEQEHQLKLRQAQEAEQTRQVYGSIPKHAADALDESKTTAKISAGALEAVQDARIAMNNGAIFGFGAEARLQANRALAYAGNKEAARVVAATQTFQSNMGPIVQQILKGIAGKDVSTKELEFVRGIAGGDIALDKEAAERILNINEKMARSTLQSHKDTVETILKGQPETAHPILRKAYEIREPRAGEPMVGGSAKPDEASSATKPIEEGRTATGSRGEKWIRRGGKWEPM